MLKPEGLFCLPAALLLGTGAILAPAVPAQTLKEAPVQALLETSDAGPSAEPAAPVSSDKLPSPAAATPEFSPELIGDTDVARHRYQAAIAAYPKAPQMTAVLWNKIGIAYQMLFDVGDAIHCYKESLKLNPDNPDAFNNLGTVYETGKEYGEAERMYRMALKLAPKSALFLKNSGTNLLAQHKYGKGWEAYQQAFAIDPTIFDGPNGPAIGNTASLQGRGAMFYYVALACLRAGLSDCAVENLRTAMNEGFTNAKKVAADEGFAGLRQIPAFRQLLAEQSGQ